MESEPYEFVVDEDDLRTFAFDTDWQLTYQVIFTPSGYVFPNFPDLDAHTFDLVIKLVENQTGNRTPPDLRIAATVAIIVQTFLRQNKRVIVYICDTSDRRQAVRARKFSGWFYKYGDPETGLSKLDKNILDKNGVLYQISLVTRADNPLRERAFDAFDDLINRENDKP